MRKLGLILLSLFAFGSYAECIRVYQNKLTDTLEEIEMRKENENVIVKTMRENEAVGISAAIASFAGGGLTAVEIGNSIGSSIMAAGSPGPSTVAAAGAMVAMGVSATILDLLEDKTIEELQSSARATRLSLGLLRILRCD